MIPKSRSGFHHALAEIDGLAAGAAVPRRAAMRLLFGIILGFLLTVGGTYIADTMAPSPAARMVNWDVVGKNVEGLTALAREGWKKIAG